MGFIDKLKQFFAGMEEKSIKQAESVFGSDVRRLADYMDSAKGKADSRISDRLSSMQQPRSMQPAPEKPAQSTAQKASAPAPEKPAAAPTQKKNHTLPEGYSVVKKMAWPTYYTTEGIFYLDDKITGYGSSAPALGHSDSSVNKSCFERLCAFVKELGYDANSIIMQQSGGKRLPYSKRFDIIFAEIMKDFPGIAGIRNKSSYLGRYRDGSGLFISVYDKISKYEFERTVWALYHMQKPFEYDKSQPLEQSVRELDAFIRSKGLLK